MIRLMSFYVVLVLTLLAVYGVAIARAEDAPAPPLSFKCFKNAADAAVNQPGIASIDWDETYGFYGMVYDKVSPTFSATYTYSNLSNNLPEGLKATLRFESVDKRGEGNLRFSLTLRMTQVSNGNIPAALQFEGKGQDVVCVQGL